MVVIQRENGDQALVLARGLGQVLLELGTCKAFPPTRVTNCQHGNGWGRGC